MNSHVSLENLLITKENIERLKPKPEKDYNVKLLLGVDNLSQSQCIRAGTTFQELIEKIANSQGAKVHEEKFFDIYNRNTDSKIKTKGKKDVDVLFTFRNILYYFECKMNLNLDSEKAKATDKKIDDIYDFLEKKKSDFGCQQVVAGVCNVWYEANRSVVLKNKVFYMKDIFNIFGLNWTEKRYYDAWNELGEKITQ